jgi:ABC-2 type transport system permease protein
MKSLTIFFKSLKEQTRDGLALSLSLVFAPFFVFLYWLLFPSGSTTYSVLVLNQDLGVQTIHGARFAGGDEVIAAFQGVTYTSGNPLLDVECVTDRADAERRLTNRDAALLVIVPAGFSRTLLAASEGQEPEPASVTFVGDLANPYYSITLILANAALDEYVQGVAGQPRPISISEEALGASGARTEFENYVPGLLVFAVIMLIFQSAMAVAREVEEGTLRRLQATRMTALEFLSGITAAQVLMGIVAVILTFLTAWVLGFRSQGPLWVAILVGAVTTLSIVGAGLVIACFARTVTQAFLIANFPLGLFMFFSSAVYPVPHATLFTLAGRSISLYDILPPTHAVVALNKVLTLGAGIEDIVYELAALLILSIVYFAAGVWLFERRHLQR